MVWILPWLDSLNLNEIRTWLVDNVAGGVITGVILIIIGIIFSTKKIMEWRDKRRIYNWLYNETKQFSGFTVGKGEDQRWCTTEMIAEGTKLSDERVRAICKEYGAQIIPMRKKDAAIPENDNVTPLREKWAIKEFVR